MMHVLEEASSFIDLDSDKIVDYYDDEAYWYY